MKKIIAIATVCSASYTANAHNGEFGIDEEMLQVGAAIFVVGMFM